MYPVSSPNNVMPTYFICFSRFYSGIQSIEKKDSRVRNQNQKSVFTTKKAKPNWKSIDNSEKTLVLL